MAEHEILTSQNSLVPIRKLIYNREHPRFHDFSDVPPEVQRRFASFFSRREYNYIVTPAASIVNPDRDPPFVSDTINYVKPMVVSDSVPKPGVMGIHDCLRTTYYREYLQLAFQTYPMKFMSHFRMLSVVASPEADIFRDGWSFLTDVLGIPPEHMHIKVFGQDQDLIQGFLDAGVPELSLQITPETERPDFQHRWTYGTAAGIEEFKGRGAAYYLKGPFRADVPEEVGNLTIVEDDKDRASAIEYGFGLDTLTSRILGLPSAFQVSIIGRIMREERRVNYPQPHYPSTPALYVVGDSIASAVAILRSGILNTQDRSAHNWATTTLHQTLRNGFAVADYFFHFSPEYYAHIAQQFHKEYYGDDIRSDGDLVEYIRNYLSKKTHAIRELVDKCIVEDPNTGQIQLIEPATGQVQASLDSHPIRYFTPEFQRY